MAKINDPPKQKLKSDLDIFAKAYFNIELTTWQKEYLESLISKGKRYSDRIRRPRAGATTAEQVLKLYIQEGLKPEGRARLPKYLLPAKPKIKGVTQEGKVLAMIKRPGGAYNFELSRIALKYTSVISSLRKDGHEIVCEPTYNRKGNRTNTYLYRIGGQL